MPSVDYVGDDPFVCGLENCGAGINSLLQNTIVLSLYVQIQFYDNLHLIKYKPSQFTTSIFNTHGVNPDVLATQIIHDNLNDNKIQ